MKAKAGKRVPCREDHTFPLTISPRIICPASDANFGLGSDENRASAALLAPRYEHSSDQAGARFSRKASMPSRASGISMLATMTALASS